MPNKNEMSAMTIAPVAVYFSTKRQPYSAGLWLLAWRRLCADRVAMASLAVVAAYLLLLLFSAGGLIAGDWADEVGVSYAPPAFISAAPARHSSDSSRDEPGKLSAEHRTDDDDASARLDNYGIVDPLQHELEQIDKQLAGTVATASRIRQVTLPFGGDKWGHDVIKKTIKGAETSILVGLGAAILATALGALFGAVSGYFGGWVDDVFNWFYSIVTAIPYLLLVLTVAGILQQKGVLSIVLILGLTGWTGTYRLMRAEYVKHKTREYVLAASAIGASHCSRMFMHIFPNVSHVVLVQLSILSVGFVKAEVILSFLGFGVPVGGVSWGSMLNEAQNELILGKWWQMAAASIAMAILVTAFSLLTDALRDALDPKLK